MRTRGRTRWGKLSLESGDFCYRHPRLDHVVCRAKSHLLCLLSLQRSLQRAKVPTVQLTDKPAQASATEDLTAKPVLRQDKHGYLLLRPPQHTRKLAAKGCNHCWHSPSSSHPLPSSWSVAAKPSNHLTDITPSPPRTPSYLF